MAKKIRVLEIGAGLKAFDLIDPDRRAKLELCCKAIDKAAHESIDKHFADENESDKNGILICLAAVYDIYLQQKWDVFIRSSHMDDAMLQLARQNLLKIIKEHDGDGHALAEFAEALGIKLKEDKTPKEVTDEIIKEIMEDFHP